MAEARIDIVVNDNSINSLESKLSTLQAELKGVGIGSAEFKRLSAEIRQTEKALTQANQKLTGLNLPELAGQFAKAAAGVGAAFAVINVAVADNEEASETARKAQEALVAVLGLAAVAEGVLATAQIFTTFTTGANTTALGGNTKELGENTLATSTNAVAKEALAAANLRVAAAEASLAEAQQISGEAIEVAEQNLAEARKGLAQAEKQFGSTASAAGEAATATRGFGASAKALGASLLRFLTSPVGIAIAAIGALVLIISKINSEMSKARVIATYGTEIDNLSEKVESAASGFDDLTGQIAAFAAATQAGILDADELAAAQEQITETALSAGLALEDVNEILASGTDALTTYINKLPELLRAEVIFASLREQVAELVKVQNDPSLSDPGFWQSAGNYVTSFGSIWQFQINQAVTSAKNYSESTSEIEDRIKNLQTALAEALKENQGFFNKLFGGDDDGGSSPAQQITDISNEIRKLTRDLVTTNTKILFDGYEEQRKLREQDYLNAVDDLNRRRQEVANDATITRKQKREFEEAAKAELLRLELEYQDDLAKIDQDEIDSFVAKQSEKTTKLKESLDRRLGLVEEYNNLELEKEELALQKLFAKEEITEEEYQKRLLDLREKFLKREEEERLNTIVTSREALEKELTDLEGKSGEEAQKRREELVDFIAQSYQDEQLIIQEYNNKYEAIEIERIENTKDAEKEATEDLKAEQEKRAEEFQNYVKGITDIIVGGLEVAIQYYASQEELLNLKLQQDLEALDKRLEKSQTAFTARQEALNNSEVLSAEAKANAIAQLEEQRLAEEKKIAQERERLEKKAAKEGLLLQSKQAKANLGIGIARAISEAAIGISAATAQAPLTFGASLALIAPIAASLAAAIGSYAAQQASIDSQLGALGFAEGGFVSGPGTGRSDSIPARLSNGEYVVNAQSTANNLPLLESINSTGGSNSADMTAVLNELRGEIKELRQKPVKAYVVTTELTEANRTEDYIERRAQL